MKFSYWEVLVGNTEGIIGDNSLWFWYYVIYGNHTYIFNSRGVYSSEHPTVYYLEDYFRDIYDPTLTELSLFELNTGITLELSNNKDSGENNE